MTSHWSPTEQNDFNAAVRGQITIHDDAGRNILQLLQRESEKEIHTIVEIGTWNGLGSTSCILFGILGKKVKFWSLECNREKHLAALENLSEHLEENIHLLWGSIVDISGITCEKYLSHFPNLESSSVLKKWFDIDVENCKECPNCLSELPEKIDFLLLDGGEFTTLYEFQRLFDRCSRYIALDDTMVDKCREVHRILSENSEWSEIVSVKARNGFSIFKKNNTY